MRPEKAKKTNNSAEQFYTCAAYREHICRISGVSGVTKHTYSSHPCYVSVQECYLTITCRD